MKRKFGWRLARLAQSCGAVHEEIRVAGGDLSAVALAKADDPRGAPSSTTSPSRNVRPSNPPKLARKSVERLPRTTGTSIPPEIASQHRQPICARLNFNSSPAFKCATCPAGNVCDPICTSNSPPHQATLRSSSKRKCKPPNVISSPAAFSSFPTSRFATRNANGSSAPLVEIPNWRNPVRPRSCTEVRKPARVTIAVMPTEVEGATQPRQAPRPGFQYRCVIVKLAHRDPSTALRFARGDNASLG